MKEQSNDFVEGAFAMFIGMLVAVFVFVLGGLAWSTNTARDVLAEVKAKGLDYALVKWGVEK